MTVDLEIKGITYKSNFNYDIANGTEKTICERRLEVSKDNEDNSERVKTSRKDIVEIFTEIQSAQQHPSQSIEGYNPPNVALVTQVPGKKIYCKVENFLHKNEHNVTPNSTDAVQFREYSHNMVSDYANLVLAYEKVFAACDEDIAFCTKLVQDNTNPDFEASYAQLLSEAKTRRQNIGEQAAEELPGRADGMMTLVNFQARIEKSISNASQEIDEFERETLRNIFLKLSEFDYSQLSKSHTESYMAITELENILAKWI